jgi:hypothetical protein
MAKNEERNDDWGEDTARKTFLYTLIGAALFAGSVFVFILR